MKNKPPLSLSFFLFPHALRPKRREKERERERAGREEYKKNKTV
jgi:hypothetical protein